MEVGFQVILCNRLLKVIDFNLLACLLEQSRGQSVTEEVIAGVKRLSTVLLLCCASRTGSSCDYLKVNIRDLGGLLLWAANKRLFRCH